MVIEPGTFRFGFDRLFQVINHSLPNIIRLGQFLGVSYNETCTIFASCCGGKISEVSYCSCAVTVLEFRSYIV